jgi:hypothetical protein
MSDDDDDNGYRDYVHDYDAQFEFPPAIASLDLRGWLVVSGVLMRDGNTALFSSWIPLTSYLVRQEASPEVRENPRLIFGEALLDLMEAVTADFDLSEQQLGALTLAANISEKPWLRMLCSVGLIEIENL